MIVYFANRQMEIMGHAATNLRKGFKIIDDLKTEDVETGVATFECEITFDESNRLELEAMTDAGNYVLRSTEGEAEFYTIITADVDTKNQTVLIYAEDAGLDLLNEVVGAYEATEAHTAEWYVNKFSVDSGFEIGLNEIPDSSTRTLSWDGESTATERLASIATQFGGFEVSYSFDIQGMEITHKYINIHEKRGKDTGEKLRLNKEIDRIITTKSVANLATAFKCTGGTPDGKDNPITLSGYEYDDGDFYVDGQYLKSRNALAKWSRYQWEKNKPAGYQGHIVKQYSYDTTSQKTLCSHALTELKKICDMEVNYEVDITKLPDNAEIGDRIGIIDAAGELYLSTRILKLETSETRKEHKATLGEHIIKSSGISQTVQDLAAQFAASAAERAAALKAAEEARKAAEQAAQDAADAADTAGQVQSRIDAVDEKTAQIEQALADVDAATEQAAQAAATAQTKAEEAYNSSVTAQEQAELAQTKADEVTTLAEQAQAEATAAATTALAAKTDAEQAKADIVEFESQLTTWTETLEADYARKTELTEASESLQVQITKNAAGITENYNKITVIDETANNAAEQAEQAQTTADEAKTAATTAEAAAKTAQDEATAAQLAADVAQDVAGQAQTDLETAEANLAALEARADATDEEITQAKLDVETAQEAADQAKANATEAQTAADNAKAAADQAQADADAAKAAADTAQKDVDALSVTVTEQGVEISKKADGVELEAYKNEVSTTLGNYYTKEETDSKISVSANGVLTTVSSTYQTKSGMSNYPTTTQMNSAIEQKANSITSTVANTYLSKTDANTTYATKTEVTQTASGLEVKISTAQDTASNAQSAANTANSTANSVKTNLANNYTPKTLPDTRNDNQNPQWYITNYPKQIITEFKSTSVIGLSGETYCTLTTTVPWGDSSGGWPKQVAKVGNKEYWRVGTSGTAWGAWQDALGTANTGVTNAAAAQSTANTANGTANAAKTAAATAQSTADTAKTTANNAANAASTAQSTANTARNEAAAAAKTATNFLSYDATNGLLVGNKTSGSWSGSRAQIKPSEFNILDSSGAVLSSFGAGTIYLAKDKRDAVIDLCGGMAKLYNNGSTYANYDRLNIESTHEIYLNTSGNVLLYADYGDYGLAQLHLEARSPWINSSDYGQARGELSVSGYVEELSTEWFYNKIDMDKYGILLSVSRYSSPTAQDYNKHLSIWMSFANNYIEVTGLTRFVNHICNGSKTGHLDGNQGIFLSNEGYIQIQRNSSAGYHPYISFHVGTTTGTDGQIRVNASSGYMEFVSSGRYTFDQSVYTAAGMAIGKNDTASSMSSRAITTVWKDGAWHYLAERNADGLTSAFGWAGSASYATITKIRGRTCQYQNSSGTTALSDERMKKDFVALDGWDGFFHDLKPYAFRMKGGNSGRYHFGYKAQDVERALLDNGLTTQDFAGFIRMTHRHDDDDPEGNAIYEAAGIYDGDDEYGLIYTEFTALNTYAIQKLDDKFAKRIAYVDGVLNEQDMRIEKLEIELADAHQEIAALKKQLAA